MTNATTTSIGIAAGIGSAVLLAAIQTGSLAVAPIFMLAPLPLVAVGLAYSPAVAAIGGAALTLAWGLVTGFESAAAVLLLIAAPVVLVVYLLNLSRAAENGKIEWYPIGRVLYAVALTVSASLILIGLFFGFDPEAIADDAVQAIMANSQTDQSLLDTDQLEWLTRLYAFAIPYALAAAALAVLVLNSWLGVRILESVGKLRRDRPPLWATGLPPAAGIILIGSAIVSLMPGTIGFAAGVVVGAFGLAHVLVGLAVIHAITIGRDARTLILFMLYVSILFIGIPVILLALIGLADDFRPLRPRAPSTPT